MKDFFMAEVGVLEKLYKKVAKRFFIFNTLILRIGTLSKSSTQKPKTIYTIYYSYSMAEIRGWFND